MRFDDYVGLACDGLRLIGQALAIAIGAPAMVLGCVCIVFPIWAAMAPFALLGYAARRMRAW